MDYRYLDRNEYRNVPILKIEDNQNNLPFFIARLKQGNRVKHRHKYVQIVYISKGKLKHVINNNTFDVHKGDIFVIPPFVPHYYIDAYEKEYEIIEFEFVPEFINERFSSDICREDSFMDFAYLEPFLVTENEMRPRLNLSGRIQMQAEGIFDEVLDEYESREPKFSLMIKALLLKLLVLVEREFQKNLEGTADQELYDQHRDAICRALRYIDENFEKDISMEAAARIAMLSPSYLRYLFKQITHRTFTEYVQNLRISKAIELLKTRKDMKIIEICYSVGYNSVSYFNRAFHEVTGVSPRAYRQP